MPGSCLQAVEVLEGVGQGAEAALDHEGAKRDLDAGGLAQRLAVGAARAQDRGNVVARLVLLDQVVDRGVGHGPDGVAQVADTEAVDRHAEP